MIVSRLCRIRNNRESRTPGAASGSGKRTGRKANTAPRPDSTGEFYQSALSTLLARINTYLMRWTRKKCKRLRPQRKARAAWERVTTQYPRYFAHWAWVTHPLMIKMARAE